MKNNNFSLKLKFCYDTLEIYRNSDFCFFFSLSLKLSLSLFYFPCRFAFSRQKFVLIRCMNVYVCMVVFFIHFKYSAFAISIWMFFNQISIQTHIDRILHIPSIHPYRRWYKAHRKHSQHRLTPKITNRLNEQWTCMWHRDNANEEKRKTKNEKSGKMAKKATNENERKKETGTADAIKNFEHHIHMKRLIIIFWFCKRDSRAVRIAIRKWTCIISSSLKVILTIKHIILGCRCHA